MAAFLIIDATEVHDEPTYAEYRGRVPSELAAAGGTYLVRGGQVEVLEGSWRPKRVGGRTLRFCGDGAQLVG